MLLFYDRNISLIGSIFRAYDFCKGKQAAMLSVRDIVMLQELFCLQNLFRFVSALKPQVRKSGNVLLAY